MDNTQLELWVPDPAASKEDETFILAGREVTPEQSNVKDSGASAIVHGKSFIASPDEMKDYPNPGSYYFKVCKA